jgi:nitroimidazol reductase NimA-like FMN-containing flavoprotein (pyridoxamine 5'-phosphate oxidase superfamily)
VGAGDDNRSMDIDRDGFEVLNRAECLRLIDGAAVGRIAGSSGALPVVLPVGYALDGDSIVIDTGRGTTLEFATNDSVVAFEVDNLHERGHAGWTVMVTGVAEEVVDADEVERLRHRLRMDRDAPEQRFVRISTELVSGRRAHRTHRHARSRAAARATERVG